MNKSRLASYLGSHRKRSGLSQKELGQLLGYPSEGTVSRHERLCSTPPFQVALGYEAVFRIPVSELFPGAFERIRQDVEARIAHMERKLQDSTAKGREAARIARKLEWIWERQNQEQIPPSHEVESA
jgi:transcriptional regulator with XRE-family HTH domain